MFPLIQEVLKFINTEVTVQNKAAPFYEPHCI